MDPGIWSRLLPELIEHILSFLPLKTLLTLRSTCKHFSSLIYNPSFIAKRPHSQLLSFLLLSHPQYHHQYPLYDSVLNRWARSSLSPSPLLVSDPVLLSVSNGLFCLSNTSSLMVCNFLTKSSRKINFPTVPFRFKLLTFVSTRAGYKILVVSTRTVFLYDSTSRSWQQFATTGFAPSDKGVYFNNCFYFTTAAPPFSVVQFDPTSHYKENVSGRNYSGPELPRDLTFIRLASDGDKKLYVLGGIGSNGISRSMKVWEVVEGSDTVVEVAKLPELMCRKFMAVCYHNYEHVYCFWHQGTICICCYTWPEILHYKVGRKTWHWLPKCPSLTDKWSCGFRWFSFLPDVSAAV